MLKSFRDYWAVGDGVVGGWFLYLRSPWDWIEGGCMALSSQITSPLHLLVIFGVVDFIVAEGEWVGILLPDRWHIFLSTSQPHHNLLFLSIFCRKILRVLKWSR